MPENMRKIFLLSRQEKLSNREIAAELSLSEQTIKNNVSEALTRLRKITDNFYSKPAVLTGIILTLLMKN